MLLTESAVEKSSFILTLHTRAQNSGTLRFSFFLFSLGPPACSAREKESRRFFESRVGRVGRVDQKKGGCDARIFVSSSQSALDWNAIFRSQNSAERKRLCELCRREDVQPKRKVDIPRTQCARRAISRGTRGTRGRVCARDIDIER